MMNKILKDLFSVGCIFIVGALAIIEIGIETIYQLVRLVKRGYGYFEDCFLKLIAPVYNNRLLWKPGKFNKSGDLKIYEFNYEEEEA